MSAATLEVADAREIEAAGSHRGLYPVFTPVRSA